MCVADAGQAYEALSSLAVAQVVQKIFSHTANTHPGKNILVSTSKENHVTFGGHVHVPYKGKVTLFQTTIEKFITAFLGMKFFEDW